MRRLLCSLIAGSILAIPGFELGLIIAGSCAVIPSAQAQSQPKKSITLQGRIEEIGSANGNILPPRLRAMTPKFDTSGSALSGSASSGRSGLSGSASTGRLQASAQDKSPTYPPDWQGTYSGTLKVHSADYTSNAYKVDWEETTQLQKVMKPGVQGTVTFEFSKRTNNQVALRPAQVIFAVPIQDTRYGAMLDQLSSILPSSSISSVMAGMPAYMALNLGDFEGGVGVSGNALQNQVVNNTVSVLRSDVLEQDIVSSTADTNSKTGRTHYGYQETVIRFTRLSSNSLYVQAVAASYSKNGVMDSRVTMYGTVQKR